MKRILVTGANKGIGLAIVRALLRGYKDTHVFLGARDLKRGEAARLKLLAQDESWGDRLEVIQLDVTDSRSVSQAAESVKRKYGEHALYALVNNAGIWAGGTEAILNVNTLGPWRVCQAFAPQLEALGRIVNVSSAAGPMYLASSDHETRGILTDAEVTWDRIEALMGRYGRESSDANSDYGFSKACLNALTLHLARTLPDLRINACTPGFIETDLTRPFAIKSGKTPDEMGMKPPEEGTGSTLFLLFADLTDNGCYYGSDAIRSPLDRYRAPGDPPYLGG